MKINPKYFLYCFKLVLKCTILSLGILCVSNVLGQYYRTTFGTKSLSEDGDIVGSEGSLLSQLRAAGYDGLYPPEHKTWNYTFRTSPWMVWEGNEYRPGEDDDDDEEEEEEERRFSGKKYIALYDDGKPGREGYKYQSFANCEYNNCEITEDYEAADLVIFFGHAFIYNPIMKLWKRPPSQRWLFRSNDNILHDFGLENDTIKSWFNWTASYKLNADVSNIMGMLQRKKNVPSKEELVQIYRKKTKVAAWYVSHCLTWSKREEYVERMSKVEPVDIYGHCGPFKCGGNHVRNKFDKTKCLPILTNTYKFYIAFENALCKDYVTEKYFKVFDNVNIIPVVRGGVDYKNAFPKGSYIDASDFDSPEDLMRYLVKLGNDEKAYVGMLRRKEMWEVNRNPENAFWCKLCKKMNINTTVSHYDDLYKFMNHDPNECWAPRDLGPKYYGLDMKTMIEVSGSPR